MERQLLKTGTFGLVLVSDLCIETMGPRMPADPTKPAGKFYTKFGRHLHSVGHRVRSPYFFTATTFAADPFA